ncbi:MAG: DHH family phosphoesterase [Clostridia bacterium]|nr:DHH family phosphoesterase [Clostridia bacterium]
MEREFLKNKVGELVALCKNAIEGGFSVVVTGHDMPDCDSIISAVMLCELISRLGVASTVKFGTYPDGVTLRDMKKLGIVDGIGFDGFDDKDMIVLVDHHVTFYENKVIGCVDHHTTPPEANFDFNLVVKASSCGRVIYDMAVACSADDDFMEKMAIYSVYLDTQSCRSPKFDKGDLPWLADGIARLGLDEDELAQMGFCLNSLDEDAEILATYAYKRYEFGGRVGASSCIQIDGEQGGWSEKTDEIVECLKRKMMLDGAFIWVLVVNKPKISRSDLYFIREDGVEVVCLDRLASRSRDVVPVVMRESQSNI